MRTLSSAVAVTVLLFVAGCGSDEPEAAGAQASADNGSASSSATAEEAADEGAPEDDLDLIEGLFEVNGHDLYARCAGHGSPTVLYLHGWMTHREGRAVDNGLWIEGKLHDEHRFCGYERRNTGRSEKVPGAQSPEEVIADITGLTEALGEKGPFILLGASFGGIVAHAFAVTHPKQVAGIVLLDALFPDEFQLYRYLTPEWDACSPQNQRYDTHRALERISQCDLYHYSTARVDREPDVPLTYLASRQERWDRSEWATPAYARRILNTQRRYVDRWSPGRFVWVDSPHFMEPEIPTRIARAITTLPVER